MKLITALCLVAISSSAYGQSLKSGFFKLSGPEKYWTLMHIFVARKAFHITTDVRNEVRIQQERGTIDHYTNGGTCDAFRHTYWMSCLANGIGRKKAKKLGIAHEKGNYKDFLHKRKEDQVLPDSLSGAMDLYNNLQGLAINDSLKNHDKDQIIHAVLERLQSGHLQILLRDGDGQLTDCNGKRVIYSGQWSQPYCIIPSFVH